MGRSSDGWYTGENLARISFPLGGMGAGMLCLEGSAALGSVSLRGQAEVYHEPMMFAALAVKSQEAGQGVLARVLEGPVPRWKVMFPWGKSFNSSANGGPGKTYGLPRFAEARFQGRFPFATVELSDPAHPVAVTVSGWSPFIPNDADNASLPVAAVEYMLRNTSDQRVEGVYSFHARNVVEEPAFLQLPPAERPRRGIRRGVQGFICYQDPTPDKPHTRAAFSVATDAPGATIDCRWFRGGWFDGPTVVWKNITDLATPDSPAYTTGEPSGGGSLYVPVDLAPGESTAIRIRFAWYVPETNLRIGTSREEAAAEAAAKASKEAGEAGCGCAPGTACCPPPPKEHHRPWYTSRFDSVDAVEAYWRERYDHLSAESAAFRDCLFNSTLPVEVLDAVSANLSILKSPTILRQRNGRLWLWEGCFDDAGCCHGSCTHVWNYAQAIAHLFPALERTLRDTEFGESQDDRGHQNFRATLPIRPNTNTWHAAADGQLGGILKVYRDWRISGDTNWLRGMWPQVKQSLAFCIEHWDPDHEGWLKEPHHNTYDIEFWGPDGMCTSLYAGALRAAALIGAALGDPVPQFDTLAAKARNRLENDLYDGEYFIQKIRWRDLHARSPIPDDGQWNLNYSEEARALLEQEGPKYQYGTGCLSDGIIGAWLAEASGLGDDLLDREKVASHLRAVHRHNFRHDLSEHANMQRPGYAFGREAGLLLCSWPKGGRLTLPFVYSDEVWTGIEYQVAAHLLMSGQVDAGLEIVRAVRSRYDGVARNPFNEFECGHWYGRALASYALLQGMTGQHYDAVTRTLHLKPRASGNWRSFLSTATGYGTIHFQNGKASVAVVRGTIAIDRIEIRA